MEFLKELTHDFDQNLKILSLFVFGQNGPWSHILDDHVVRKQATLDYKNIGFTKLPYWIERGVTHDLPVVSSRSFSHCIIPLDPTQMVEYCLAANHSACINSCPKSVSQSAMQSVSQTVSQPLSQSVCQSVSQPVSQSVSQLVNQLVS